MRRQARWKLPALSAHWLLIILVACCIAPSSEAQVEITGLDDVLLENALIHLDLDEESCDAPPWRVAEQFGRADDEIRTAVEAYGYYNASITAALDLGDTCWAASFDVELGDPVRLRRVDISLAGAAADDPVFTQLIDASSLVEGEPLLHGAYERLKGGLQEAAQRRGYVEGVFTASRIDVYPPEYAADVVLRFDSGPRYTFGDIRVNQDVLEPAMLERYYEFRTGDPYTRVQLTALYTALANSGYFNTVDVRPLTPDAERKQIPIAINLTAGNRRTLSYGVGFSTDTGPRLRLGRTNRRVNAKGAQFGVNGQLSPVISELTFNYRFPYGDPRTEWISLDAGAKHEDTETSVSDTLEFGVRRVNIRRSNWQETQFVDLQVGDFEVGDTQSRSRLLTPGISWLRIVADNTLRPERGRRLSLEVTGAGDALGSDTSFLQVTAEGKWIWSFRNDNRLLIRGRVGATWEDNFDELPPSVRFFAGGDDSVRGYEFRSLGPLDAAGNVIGGNRLAVGSIEYEFPVVEKWSVALFVDAGNAFKDKDFETKSGAGAGFRWQSPLGPIRVDVAKPLDDDDRSVRLHVSLGADL